MMFEKDLIIDDETDLTIDLVLEPLPEKFGLSSTSVINSEVSTPNSLEMETTNFQLNSSEQDGCVPGCSECLSKNCYFGGVCYFYIPLAPNVYQYNRMAATKVLCDANSEI